MNKKGSLTWVFIVLAVSSLIALFWDSLPFIKESIHFVLSPTIGALLNWNTTWGMIIVTFILMLITILLQKYATDQERIKELKDHQKKLQEEAKKHKDNPEKTMELTKQTLESAGEMMTHAMRPIIYTGIPLILLFRWFHDYFTAIPDFRFFGVLGWLWAYIILSIIFSLILRKVLKVA